MPTTFLEYEALFVARCAIGDILADAGGESHTIAASSAEGILSTVRQTLRYRWQEEADASARARGESAPRRLSAAQAKAHLAERDVAPYLPTLERDAARMAAAKGHRAPRNAANNARRFLDVVVETDSDGRVKAPERFVAPAWAEVMAACDALKDSGYSRRVVKHFACRIAILAFEHGVSAPKDLPDRRAVEQWMAADGWNANDGYRCFMILRKLTAHLRTAGAVTKIPDFPTKATSFARNLRAEPRVRALVVLPEGEKFDDLDARGIIKHLAPKFDELLARWEAIRPDRRPSTRKQVLDVFDRLLAEAVRAGLGPQLKTMHPRALLETGVDPALLAVSPPARGVTTDAWEAEATGATPESPSVPLLLYLLDRQAPAAARRSPLAARAATRGTDTFYPVTILDAAGVVWRAMDAVLKPMLSEKHSGQLMALRAQYERVLDHLTLARTAAEVDVPCKNASKLIDLVTLPLLTCVGLPALAAYVSALAAAYEDAEATARRHGRGADHTPVRRARDAYWQWLERYVVLAVLTADPLRVKNWLHACLGPSRELRLTLNPAGELVAAQTWFTGAGGDNEAAALKKRWKGGRKKRERRREWPWSLSVVDPVLFKAYLEGPRAERIRARRLHVPVKQRAQTPPPPYSLAAELAGGGYPPIAVVVAPAPRNGKGKASGGYGKNAFGRRFGEGLHWVCRFALGRDLPDLSAMDSDWFALFAPHIVRTLWATYWIGVRERTTVRRVWGGTGHAQEKDAIAYACEATNDGEAALRGHYDEVSAAMQAQMRRAAGHWDHPQTYNAWMDRTVWADEVIVWANERQLPLPPHLPRGFAAPPPGAALARAPRVRRRRDTRFGTRNRVGVVAPVGRASAALQSAAGGAPHHADASTGASG